MKALKKTIMCLVIATCTIGAMFASGTSESGNKTYTIKVGDNWGATHPMGRALASVFKPEVEKATNGAVKVDIYSDGTLGNEADLWNGVRNGTIEMAVVGTPFNQEWSKALISDWPFLYSNLEHAKRVWSGEIADELNKEFHEKFPTAYMLSWGPNSARTFSSNKKLTSVADFKGQKFRMPSNPIHVGIAENLGASAQVISLSELFSALETGVVDGQDNGMVTILSQSFDQVQKYVFETNHIIATLEIILSASFFDNLPIEYQTAIKNAAKKTTETAWNDYIASVDKDRETLRSRGVTVTECTDANRDEIIQKIQPLLKSLNSQYPWAQSLTERIKNY